MNDPGRGSLIVAGLGIRLAQITQESRMAVEQADVVFSVVTNPVAMFELEQMNQEVRDLRECYRPGRDRLEGYQEMVEIVLDQVRDGRNVCFIVYGHPGVFAWPTNEAIRRARAEGYPAKMLPGISAEDSLFADLGLDPAEFGCQSFEANDFMLYDRVWDLNSVLVLWQVGVIGVGGLVERKETNRAFDSMRQRLIRAYGPDKIAMLYEAAILPRHLPRTDEVELSELSHKLCRPETTMVIRPSGYPDKNLEFAKLAD